jgi:hypothetical protein
MTEPTTGLASAPPSFKIIMVRNASRTFKLKIKKRRKSNPEP